jgi:hypothetical protein
MLLIPHSLHTIGNFHVIESSIDEIFPETSKLEYLVFESRTELRLIGDSAFAESRWLKSLFLPSSIRVIDIRAFVECASVACINFGHPSSLGQLSQRVFWELSHLTTITIPSSVRRIDALVFHQCRLLRTVEFALPSQCWYVHTNAFTDCPSLKPISLPSSVEVIDREDLSFCANPFPFVVNGHHLWIRDDCLVRTNELVRYLGP